MLERLKKFLSRFTDRKIPAGVGVSTDDTFTTGHPVTPEQVENAQRVTKMGYVLRDTAEVGGFELVGQVRKGDKVLFQIRHTLTGEVVNFPKSVLDLLFVKR
jgi:hypothetical protein